MSEEFLFRINKQDRYRRDEAIAKVQSIIYQMKLIDEHLKDLFFNFDEEILADHNAFLLFRGKVSKRIIGYSDLICQCQHIIDYDCDEVSKNVKQEVDIHFQNLQNYKKELSLWWKKHEKDYHRLCLKLYLDIRDGDADGYEQEDFDNDNDMDKEKKKEKENFGKNLIDTKKMMLDEVNRMKNVKSELIESSNKLKKQDAIFNSFESKIKSSGQLILSLKKKTENDTKYVWFSFFFFLSVCVYIILRRLGFIRAAISITKLLVSTIIYILKNLVRFIFLFKRKTLPEAETETEVGVGVDIVTEKKLVELNNLIKPVFQNGISSTISTNTNEL